MDTNNNLHSFCYWHYNYVLRIGNMILCFRVARKGFLSTIFLVINVHQWNETDLDTCINVHFFLFWALQSCSPHWETWYLCFGFVRQAFFLTIFLIIKGHLWNETNLDTYNNLHSICYYHYNHVLLIAKHSVNGLDLQ